jgi:hypothetical protein
MLTCENSHYFLQLTFETPNAAKDNTHMTKKKQGRRNKYIILKKGKKTHMNTSDPRS